MPRPQLSWNEVPHGTISGYDWHQRRKDGGCEACREAKRKASREWARNKRATDLQDAGRKAAWQRACSKLAERHPVEFREILLKEMEGVIVLPPEEGEPSEV